MNLPPGERLSIDAANGRLACISATVRSSVLRAHPVPPPERGKMPASSDEQRGDAVDVKGEGPCSGIPDADTVGR
jgi:hypothetical protein